MARQHGLVSVALAVLGGSCPQNFGADLKALEQIIGIRHATF